MDYGSGAFEAGAEAVAGYASGTRLMTLSFSGIGVPPCWRAYFLLFAQKKVAKEKVTPGSAPGVARSLALLGRPGGWLNSPAAQTTRADCPRPACVAQRLSRGPVNHPYSECLLVNPSHRRKPVSSALNDGVETEQGFQRRPHERTCNRSTASNLLVFPGPLRGAEQRRNAGGSRLALSEPQASLASRPAFRVAQGTRQRRAPTQGWPFLWLLSFGHTKESTPANKAEPQANSSTRAQGPAPC